MISIKIFRRTVKKSDQFGFMIELLESSRALPPIPVTPAAKDDPWSNIAQQSIIWGKNL